MRQRNQDAVNPLSEFLMCYFQQSEPIDLFIVQLAETFPCVRLKAIPGNLLFCAEEVKVNSDRVEGWMATVAKVPPD